MSNLARLAEVIRPEAEALGFELVRVMITGSEAQEGEPALQIMAEDPATRQLRLEQCAALSRRISDRLDALEEAGEVLMKGAYNLEVSSPGIDRPLTRIKDYADWSGHEARIELHEPLNEQKRFRGDLGAPSSDGVHITIIDRQGVSHSLPFAAIHSARLVLTDRLIAATRPLDSSDADDIMEEQEGET